MINSNCPNTQGSGGAVRMPKRRRQVPFSLPWGTLSVLRLLPQEGRREPALRPVLYLPAPCRCLEIPAELGTALGTYVLGTGPAPQIAAFLYLVSLFFLAGCRRRQTRSLRREGVKVTPQPEFASFFPSPHSPEHTHVFYHCRNCAPFTLQMLFCTSHSFCTLIWRSHPS